jgi:hypothetical protein
MAFGRIFSIFAGHFGGIRCQRFSPDETKENFGDESRFYQQHDP